MKLVPVHAVVDPAGNVVGLRREERCPHRHAALTAGPAQVATESYRQNWDGIFGARPTVGEA